MIRRPGYLRNFSGMKLDKKEKMAVAAGSVLLPIPGIKPFLPAILGSLKFGFNKKSKAKAAMRAEIGFITNLVEKLKVGDEAGALQVVSARNGVSVEQITQSPEWYKWYWSAVKQAVNGRVVNPPWPNISS